MLKKMMLLASLALAAIAFAVPASASASVWNGTHEDSLTGFISFGNPEPGQTKFGCEAHAGISVIGATTTGSVNSFEPTTETCKGEGSFANCKLVEDSTTMPTTTLTIVETNKYTITTPAGNPIVLHNHYDAACPITKSTLTVSHLSATGTGSDLTDLTISGLATSHVTLKDGTVLPPQTVAVFGTMGTETNTITTS